MRKVIIVPESIEVEHQKPIELTYRKGNNGWEKVNKLGFGGEPDTKKIFYLGNCATDGDMFALTTTAGHIRIYKGHLNSGNYDF